jgi:hypothetical protein
MALKELFKLMLSVHVFTHSSLIPEEDVQNLRWRERYSVKPIIEGYYALPPMANRALKCIYSRIINKTLQSVLERLQRILHGSSKMAKWMMAFCSVLVLAMCLESLQSTIRMNYNDLYKRGEITKQDSEIRAQARCSEIDKSFLFIMTLFRHKFTNSFNFITGQNLEYLGEDRNGAEFVKKVSELFGEKRKQLQSTKDAILILYSETIHQRAYTIEAHNGDVQRTLWTACGPLLTFILR